MIPDFKTAEDLREWMEPMGYNAFMEVMLDVGLYDQADVAHCDHTLETGIADMQTVCEVTKFIAYASLVEQWGLPFRVDLEARTKRPELRPVH